MFARHGPNDVVRTGLREIVAVREVLDRLEAALVVEGRRRGSHWSELGADLGLSLHGARKRHLVNDPIYAWKLQRPPTPAEEIGRLATEVRGTMVE